MYVNTSLHLSVRRYIRSYVQCTNAAAGQTKSQHAAYYLIKSAANVCQVMYLTKFCPQETIHMLLLEFDDEVQDMVDNI